MLSLMYMYYYKYTVYVFVEKVIFNGMPLSIYDIFDCSQWQPY